MAIAVRSVKAGMTRFGYLRSRLKDGAKLGCWGAAIGPPTRTLAQWLCGFRCLKRTKSYTYNAPPQPTPPPNLTYHPIVIKLAFPPAAAVFTLSERSSSRRSSRIPVSPCENPCTDTIAPGRSAIFSHRLRSWSESPW